MFTQKDDAFLAAKGIPHEYLPSKFYSWNSTHMGMFFNVKYPQKEVHVPYGYQQNILDQINLFFTLQSGYAKLGLSHKRGFLLHGDPGCGKTFIARMAAQIWIANGGIVLEGGEERELSEAVKLANNKILVIIDDVDEWDDSHLTHCMDGVQDASGICWLATTNFIDRVSDRLKRPGRFDEVIEVIPPPPADSREWVESLPIPAKQKRMVISKLEGKTPSEVREMVIRVHLLNKSI